MKITPKHSDRRSRSGSRTKQRKPTRAAPVDPYVYFEIEAELQVHVELTKYLLQGLAERTQDMLRVAMPSEVGPCQGIVLNPEEGPSSYVTTTVLVWLGLRMKRRAAQRMSNRELGKRLASTLSQIDLQAAQGPRGASAGHECPEIRGAKVTFVARSNQAPDWYPEAWEQREEDLIRLRNDRQQAD